MTKKMTATIETMIHDIENYATVERVSGTKLRISCRDDLCDDVESTCEGSGWSVAWAGEGNTDGRTGRTYEDGTVTLGARPTATPRIYLYAVTGDHSRLVYSRHTCLIHAQAACRRLARQWGPSHVGAEPRVVFIPLHDRNATHIQGGHAAT